MAISGRLEMEDQILVYEVVYGDGGTEPMVHYTLEDKVAGYSANMVVPAKAFMAALSIALHWDGEPDAERDYPAAESVQPKDPKMRWIP